jgi:hypothetical protein
MQPNEERNVSMKLFKSHWGSGLTGGLAIAALLSTLLPLSAQGERVDTQNSSVKPNTRTPHEQAGGGQIEAATNPNTQEGTPAGFEIDGTQVCGDASGLGFTPALSNGDDWGNDGGACTGEADPADVADTVQFTDCNWGSQGDRGDSTQFGSAGIDDGSNTNFDLIGCEAGQHPWEWNGIGGNPQKDDITNVFVHRRSRCTENDADGGGSATECEDDGDCAVDGETCHDWLFLGLETRATNGDRHADFEINQDGLFVIHKGDSCDPANGTQDSCESGDTCCDDSLERGRIIGAGAIGGRSLKDLLITFDYERGGERPILSIREWTAGATYDDVTGLVQGVNVFGQVNAGGDESNTAFPWHGFDTHGKSTDVVERLQFVEVGIDQTDLGIEFGDSCLPDATVMAKTRSSQSVSAELKDWVLHQFPVVPPPTCEAEGDEVCAGFDARLRAKGTGGKPPYTITWRDSSGAVVGTPCTNVAEGAWCNLDFTPATVADADTYTATVADRRGCVDEPCPVDLIVNPNPTADAGADDDCLETGGPLQVGGSPTASGGTPGYTYLWSGAKSSCLTDTSIANPTLDKDCAGEGTHVLCVTITDSKGCVDDDCGDFTVHPEPTADAGGDADCLETGGPLQVGGSPTASGGTPGYTYAWSGAKSACLSDTSLANPTLDKACAGVGTHQLCVLVTDSNGCTDDHCGDFTVYPEPTADAGGDADCLETGGPLQVGGSPTASGGTAGYTYAWSGAKSACLSDTAVANPTLDKTCAGVGTHQLCVLVTDSNGCTDNSCGDFIVHPEPTADAGGDADCIDPSGNLQAGGSPTASGGTPGYTYAWTGAKSTCLNNTDTANPTLDKDCAGAGTHELCVLVTDANGCTDSHCGNFTVYPEPACELDNYNETTPIPLTGTVITDTTGSGTYTCTATVTGAGWSIDAVDGCLVDGLTIKVNYTVTQPATPTPQFEVTVVDGNGCDTSCSKDLDIVFACLTRGAEVCAGESATLCAWSISGASPTFDLTWDDPSGTAIPSFTCDGYDLFQECCNTIDPTVLGDAGNYTVTSKDEIQGFPSTCLVPLAINPNPVADAGADIMECLDDFLSDPQVGGSPTSTGGTGAITYTWTGDTTCLSSTTDANPTFDISCAGPGSYQLCVNVSDSKGCEDDDCMDLVVYPEPTADAGPDITDCLDDFSSDPAVGGSPTASGGTTPYTYSWTGTGSNCLSDTGAANPTFDLSCGAGVYDLCVEVTDANGCVDSDCMKLTIHPEPTADAGPDITDCLDDFTSDPAVGGSPTASGGTTPYAYSWTGAGSNCLSDTSAANPTFDVSCGAGVYDLCVEVTDANGCVDSDCMKLTIHPEPTCTVDPATAEICSTETQQFCAVPTGGTPGYTYLWSTGSTDACITVSDAGTYTVTVTDFNGCKHDCEGMLTVIPCGQACSPGFWRNNLDEWCLTPFNPSDNYCAPATLATTFNDAFMLGGTCGGAPSDTALSGNVSTLTLHSAVSSSGGNNQTLFHCSAALLSSTIMGFPLETSQVKQAVQDACDGTISWKDAFQICRDANAVEFEPNGCCPFSDPDCPLPTTSSAQKDETRTKFVKPASRR